jgi:hypothetical protein
MGARIALIDAPAVVTTTLRGVLLHALVDMLLDCCFMVVRFIVKLSHLCIIGIIGTFRLANLQRIQTHFSILVNILVKRCGGSCGVAITSPKSRGNREEEYQDLLGHRCDSSDVWSRWLLDWRDFQEASNFRRDILS